MRLVLHAGVRFVVGPDGGIAPHRPHDSLPYAIADLTAVMSPVATSYLLGVSTRRVVKLVEQLGVAQLSKSQVPERPRIWTPR